MTLEHVLNICLNIFVYLQHMKFMEVKIMYSYILICLNENIIRVYSLFEYKGRARITLLNNVQSRGIQRHIFIRQKRNIFIRQKREKHLDQIKSHVYWSQTRVQQTLMRVERNACVSSSDSAVVSNK
jgi:hypothetical protein